MVDVTTENFPVAGVVGPHSFTTAARAVLRLLHAHYRFDLWMVTRKEGDNWIVLQVEDSGYGVEERSVFRWTDSFCSRMAVDLGPRIAPCSASIPAYADAPIGRHMKIGSYVGVPLTFADGSLFGTLCAIHPDPQLTELTGELPWFELIASLLSSLLHNELTAVENARLAERTRAEADTDALTGLFNRRAWDRFMAAEDSRCYHYGHAACVVAIDLDNLRKVNYFQGHAAGDSVIYRASQAIRNATCGPSVAARVGGDEFTVLGVECSPDSARQLTQKIRANLAQARVAASVGFAMRTAANGLTSSWDHAVRTISEEKNRKKSEALLSDIADRNTLLPNRAGEDLDNLSFAVGYVVRPKETVHSVTPDTALCGQF